MKITEYSINKDNPYISQFNINNKGYILYTVLVVLTIASILFTVSLYSLRSTVRASFSLLHKIQSRFLSESGISRTEFFLNGGDGRSASWETDLYRESIDNYGEIIISCKRFGLFSLVQSVGNRLSLTDTITGLVGRTAPPLLKHSLVLTNKSGGCLLIGNSSINGTIVLDHGYITNRPRTRRTLPEYRKRLFTRNSPQVPFDSLTIKTHVDILKKAYTAALQSDSIMRSSFIFSNRNDSLLSKHKIIIDGDCIIDCPINSRIIIARGKITLTSNAYCNNLSLSSDKVILKNGSSTNHSLLFSKSGIKLSGGFHNSQFISTDSIIIPDKISFGSSNSIISYRTLRNDSSVTGGIYIQSGAHIRGTVISFIDPSHTVVKKSKSGASIVIDKNVTVTGYVISNHDINIRRSVIEGSLWARSIVTRDSSKTYLNSLIDMKIVPLTEDIVFPLIGALPIEVVVDRS